MINKAIGETKLFPASRIKEVPVKPPDLSIVDFDDSDSSLSKKDGGYRKTKNKSSKRNTKNKKTKCRTNKKKYRRSRKIKI